MLRDAGATAVHMLITSPPIIAPCYYGIDTSSADQLIAARLTIEEIREQIGADSLGFLSEEGMLDCMDLPRDSFCTACLNHCYPVKPEDCLAAQ